MSLSRSLSFLYIFFRKINFKNTIFIAVKGKIDMSERASLINDKIFIFKVDIEPNEILDNRLLYRV